MPGLMMNEISFPKPTSIQLEKDPATWERAVYAEFASKTDNDPRPNKLEIKKEDAAKGFLFGWITMINSVEKERIKHDPYNRMDSSQKEQETTDDDTNIYFPVIIKDWTLAPMDIFIHKGKFYPVNEKNLNFTKDDGVVGRKMDPNEPLGVLSGRDFADQTRPQVVSWSGRYGSSNQRLSKTSSDKEYKPMDFARLEGNSILENLKDTLEPQKMNKLASDILSNQRVLNIVTIHAPRMIDRLHKVAHQPIVVGGHDFHMTVLKKIASGPCVPENIELAIMTKKAQDKKEPEIYTSKKRVLEAFNEIANPEDAIMDGPKGDFANITSGKMNKVDLVKAITQKPVDMKKQGLYEVLTKRKVAEKGFLFPVMVDFNQNKIPMKLFVTENGDYMIKKSMSGVPCIQDTKIKYAEPMAGKVGVLCYEKDDSFLATEPFHIIAAVSNNKNFPLMDEIAPSQGGSGICSPKGIRVKCGDGKEKFLMFVDFEDNGEMIVKADGLKKFEELSKKNDVYMVPDKFKFIQLNTMVDAETDPQQIEKKAMDQFFGSNRTQILYSKTGGYTIDHPYFMDKQAAMDDIDFLHNITLLGCPMEKALEIAKEATEKREVSVVGLASEPFLKEKVALDESRLDDLYNNFIRDIKGVNTNLLKEAADILFHLNRSKSMTKMAEDFGTSESLDNLLALNFINRNNLIKFVAAIPLLNKSLNLLSEMLFVSRIGEETLPEGAISSSLEALSRILNGLEALKRKIA